jgi:glycosyltransferase involved in cell wall biosynthesis
MNICIIFSTPFPPREGIGFYVWNLSNHLVKKGHQVHLITRGSSQPLSKKVENGITIWRPRFFPVYPYHAHIHNLFVNSLIKDLEPHLDLVHIQTPLVKIPTTTKPILVTVHTPLKVDTRHTPSKGLSYILDTLQAPFSIRIEQELFKKANQIVTVSGSVSSELEEYGINPSTTKVFGVGVDTDIFFPSKTLNNSQPYLLTAGRLAPRKGFSDFIRCAEIILKERPDLKFLIAGSGPLEKKLQKQIKECGLERKIFLLGQIQDRQRMVDLYRGALAYLHPAHYEGLPAVMLEAMACSCPVIVTSVSGALEVIEQDINGILVPPKNPDAMAASALRLLKDPSLSDKLGKAAYQTIQGRFSWKIVSERYLCEYGSLLGVNLES